MTDCAEWCEPLNRGKDPAHTRVNADNLIFSFLQGYHDGIEGQPLDPCNIVLMGKEHLIGDTNTQGWRGGGKDTTDKGGVDKAE